MRSVALWTTTRGQANKGVVNSLSFEADACHMFAQNERARRQKPSAGTRWSPADRAIGHDRLPRALSRGRFCRILKSALPKASFAYFGGKPERCAYMAFEPDSAQLLSRLPTHLTTDLFAGANPVKLAADQVLFVAGDPGDSCYRVERGLLKVTMVSRSGIERILTFIGRGGIVGELAIIDGLPRSASVVAVRDTAFEPTYPRRVRRLCGKASRALQSLITLFTQRLRETNVAVAAGSFLSLRGRVALALLELADHFRRDVGSLHMATYGHFRVWT